jgi:hypothetical protein
VAGAAVIAARAASRVTEGGADRDRERQPCKHARKDLPSRDLHSLSLPSPSDFGAPAEAASTPESKGRLEPSSVAKSRVEVDSPVDQRAGLAAAGMATPACDFCGAACTRSQRRRLMWKAEGGDELVLADLCARCGAHADRLLDVYGGRGRASMRLTGPGTPDAIPLALVRRASGALMRAVVYVLIALAVFFIVTLITSRG